MPKVLVTPRSITAQGGHPALTPLADAGYHIVFSSAGQLPDEDEVAALLPGCAGYLAGVEAIGKTALARADRLRVISRNGVGTDRIDAALLREKGIELCNAPGANARGVAELALGLIFAITRGIPQADHGIKQGGWPRQIGTEVRGATLGLVGFGRIGRMVAELALGVGMRVVVFDPQSDAASTPAHVQPVELDQLTRSADIISFHCPPAADGRPILDRAAVGRLKDGAYLVNTARSDLLDAEAVLDALESGKIAGLALDVFDSEPPEPTPLLRHKRVVTTSHMGGYTRQSVHRAVSMAVENLLRHLPILNETGAGHA